MSTGSPPPSRHARPSIPLVWLGLALLVGPALAAPPVMPFDEVEPGMRGTGRTVFRGTEIESFEVEILGKLPNVGPDQNLILARCSGGPLAETGVLAGMSGSPVTIDGRLVGAISYSWGFAKTAVAGITPIEEMLAVAERDAGGSGERSLAPAVDRELLAPLIDSGRLQRFLTTELIGSFQRPAGALPVSIPLSVAGLGGEGLARLAPWLGGAGFLPLQAGSSRGSAETPPRLEPGSAIGLQLVRGDLEVTATGTATWVEGDRVLGFGHPLFGLGSVDLPMTGAAVQTLLPSLMRSARIATPLAEIGALRQDRASGVFGLLGSRPAMIPVRFKLSGSAFGEKTYSYDIADDPLLSPLLLYFSLNGILASRERPFGSATVRLGEGSVIKLADAEDVELDNVFAGTEALDYGTGIGAYILYILMNNTWSRPRIVGINLILEYDQIPHSGTIRRASLDRYRVRAGESLQAAIVVEPFRGRDRVYTIRIRIPEETPPGPIVLRVGGAVEVGRAEARDEPLLPRDLDQLIGLINRLRRNDRIYVVATADDNGFLLGGARLPNLPPSATTVLSRPRNEGGVVRFARRTVLEESVQTDFAVRGSASIQLEVEAP